jgi:hypothetical protein
MNTQPQGTPLNMETAELLLRQIVFNTVRHFGEATHGGPPMSGVGSPLGAGG